MATIACWGMSTLEITGHLRELYSIDVSPDLISTVTGRAGRGRRLAAAPA
jgi:transposase-like protein